MSVIAEASMAELLQEALRKPEAFARPPRGCAVSRCRDSDEKEVDVDSQRPILTRRLMQLATYPSKLERGCVGHIYLDACAHCMCRACGRLAQRPFVAILATSSGYRIRPIANASGSDDEDGVPLPILDGWRLWLRLGHAGRSEADDSSPHEDVQAMPVVETVDGKFAQGLSPCGRLLATSRPTRPTTPPSSRATHMHW